MYLRPPCRDLLTMLPQQWRHSPLTAALLHIFEIQESLPAAPICIVRRARLPLTPAAEYLCDMMRRAAQHPDNQVPRTAPTNRRARLAATKGSKNARRRRI